jgi:hypothetical protein
MQEIDRDDIVTAVRRAVEHLPSIIAMWEGGSAAWGREDVWSDVDLQLLVEDDFVSETINIVEKALAGLSPIEIRFEVPQPTRHGHEQVFYRLRDAGEFRLVDLAIMRRSSPNQLRERERHGFRRIAFDKTGEAQPTPLDRDAHAKRVAERLRQLLLTFPLFQCLIKKELLRGNPIGAVSRYYSNTLHPLVTLLRIRHYPDRFDFGPDYAAIDLPPEVLQRITPLWFVRDVGDVEAKRAQAEEFFYEVLEEVRDNGIWDEAMGTQGNAKDAE